VNLMALYYVAGKVGRNGRYEEIARDSHREEYEQALAPARGSGVIFSATRAGPVDLWNSIVRGAAGAARDGTPQPHPELIKQQLPERVVLVIADSLRQCDRDARVEERQPGRAVRELSVDFSPLFRRDSRTLRLEGGRMAALGIDLRVAELGDVQVSRVAWAKERQLRKGSTKFDGAG
jgi:hypothetical protein